MRSFFMAIKTKMNKFQVCFSLITLMTSFSAFSMGMVSCETSSNGYSFSDQSYDRYLAERQSIDKCTKHSQTTNDECFANIACSDSYSRPMITCSTSSNGYSFSDISRDASVASRESIKKCTNHSQTSNDECNANISCNDNYERPMVTCSTSSNGYSFADQSRDPMLASRESIKKCTSHSQTTNDECNVNISCDNAPSRPMVACSTSSNGYNFRDEARDTSVAIKQSVLKCTNHSQTNNAECNANIICDGQRSGPVYPTPIYPEPVYPAPIQPAPDRRGEICSIRRFDPSGILITVHEGRGRGRREACEQARNQCRQELKGRQYCE